MSNSDLPEVTQPSQCGDPTMVTHHHNLLLTSAILTTSGVIAAAAYGMSKDFFVLRALAVDMSLTVLAVLLCMNARRLQHKATVLEQAPQADTPPPATQSRFSQWEGGLAEVDDAGALGASWDIEHAQKLHFMFLALIPTAVIVLLAARGFWISRGYVAAATSSGAATALALVSLAASCLWLILARSFQAVPAEELPESKALALAFREVQWASLITAASLLVSCFWPAAETWAGRLLLGWVIILGVEQLGRLLVARLRHSGEMSANIPPLRLLLREALFLHGNPAHGLFEALESVLGVSFRSSWAIRFVRRSIVPATLLVALLFWALSSLAVVQIDELGVRESFGRVHTAPLSPGLHWKLPWPCGEVRRYSVKRVSVKPIGFVSQASRRPNLLWSKKHAEEEFGLVLGDGSELVAAGCVVYYKIHEDRERFLDYVYRCQNPDDLLEAYAYRTLMEHTRSNTLREVLTANRAQFADRLKETLRGYAESDCLGIEVVDVALMGLHPPVEAADAYLDVISARIDAERVQVEALGQKSVRIAEVRRESATAVAAAQTGASRRTGTAVSESSEFVAIGEAYAVAPESFQLRLWFEALEEILEQKRFVLVDQEVNTGLGGILLDHRGRISGRSDPVPLTRDAGFSNRPR